MQAYYARRAAVYEAIYAKPERQADLRQLEAALPPLFDGRLGLEIACGTGWWTPHAARDAAAWLATDVNPETLAVARGKPLPAGVKLAEADAFALDTIAGTFDAAFAGFWWSHLTLQQLPGWLAALHARLEPGARVAFIDNRFVAGSSTPLSHTDAGGNTWQQRGLPDGSRHAVVKNFPTRESAVAALGDRAAGVRWTELTHYWLLTYELSA